MKSPKLRCLVLFSSCPGLLPSYRQPLDAGNHNNGSVCFIVNVYFIVGKGKVCKENLITDSTEVPNAVNAKNE